MGRASIESFLQVENQKHLYRTEEMNLTSVDMQKMILIAEHMQIPPVTLQYEPTQPPRKPVPYH